MKLTVSAQNFVEWLALQCNMVPTPLAFSKFGGMTSKFLLEAVDKGIFEAIGTQSATVETICQRCNVNSRAVESLLQVFVSMGLLLQKKQAYSLTSKAKKWLLKDSPYSLYYLMVFDNRVCFNWLNYTGEFLQSGKGLQYHEHLTSEEWFYYQKAMEAAARITATEARYKLSLPPNATHMLDIGGSHGLYSIALCKKYKTLSSTILDLPEAVTQARPILESYNMGSRIGYMAGNILHTSLTNEHYDFIMMANVAHHLSAEENELVTQKVYRALKKGGKFSIMEVVKPGAADKRNNMLSALGDFFFALSSTSGTWQLETIKNWQINAGFTHITIAKFLGIPGFTAITAVKR